ncbi:MAG: PRC-barrel domain-containing protein [Alphaproteobacteria bacterium]|nr:PRC-barrel domain-containing protein [Alphaproteobacteria bacterium]
MKARLIATAAVISLGLGGAAFAQTDSTRSPGSTPPGAGTPPAASSTPSTGNTGSGMSGSSMTATPDATGGAWAGVDAKELVGTDIKNAQNETIGEVQAVQLDSAGKVRNLIVGVGGFLGLGERAVAVQPGAVMVADNGDTIRTTLTKDQLKAMPEYQYSDKSHKGEVFNDSGVVKK